LSGKIPLEDTRLNGDEWVARTQVELSKAPPINKSYRNKFIPDLDQLHEMEQWRKFALKRYKRGESLDFEFNKTLPAEIVYNIKSQLLDAKDEDSIKAAFEIADITSTAITEMPTNDIAILELADAINKACEKENQNDNLQ
jgi:hypothetical protein